MNAVLPSMAIALRKSAIVAFIRDFPFDFIIDLCVCLICLTVCVPLLFALDQTTFELLFLIIVLKWNQLDSVFFHILTKPRPLIPVDFLGVLVTLNLKAVRVNLFVGQLHLRRLLQETDLDQKLVHILRCIFQMRRVVIPTVHLAFVHVVIACHTELPALDDPADLLRIESILCAEHDDRGGRSPMKVFDSRYLVISVLQFERITSKHYALLPNVTIIQRLEKVHKRIVEDHNTGSRRNALIVFLPDIAQLFKFLVINRADNRSYTTSGSPTPDDNGVGIDAKSRSSSFEPSHGTNTILGTLVGQCAVEIANAVFRPSHNHPTFGKILCLVKKLSRVALRESPTVPEHYRCATVGFFPVRREVNKYLQRAFRCSLENEFPGRRSLLSGRLVASVFCNCFESGLAILFMNLPDLGFAHLWVFFLCY